MHLLYSLWQWCLCHKLQIKRCKLRASYFLFSNSLLQQKSTLLLCFLCTVLLFIQRLTEIVFANMQITCEGNSDVFITYKRCRRYKASDFFFFWCKVVQKPIRNQYPLRTCWPVEKEGFREHFDFRVQIYLTLYMYVYMFVCLYVCMYVVARRQIQLQTCAILDHLTSKLPQYLWKTASRDSNPSPSMFVLILSFEIDGKLAGLIFTNNKDMTSV